MTSADRSLMHDETSNDVILEGMAGIYRRIDLNTGWGDMSSVIPADSDLRSLDFKLVGDLVCSALNGILRCYAHLTEGTRAILILAIKDGRLGIAGLFFESHFADGTSLTTTTSAAMKDMPEHGRHRRIYASKGVHALYHHHQRHRKELEGKHGNVQPMSDTLLSVAESIDSDTVRLCS